MAPVQAAHTLRRARDRLNTLAAKLWTCTYMFIISYRPNFKVKVTFPPDTENTLPVKDYNLVRSSKNAYYGGP